MNLRLDWLIAILCILLAGIYLSASFSILQGSFGDPMGARVFPQILGTLLILLSLITLVQSSPQAAEKTPAATFFAIGLCAVLIVGFVLVLPALGYTATAFLGALGFLLILREKLISAAAYAVGLTLVFHIVFVLLLKTPFPQPSVGGMF